jgi:hypothetical protein
MKPFHFLMATGDNAQHALQLLKEQIDKEYSDKACKINQIFMLPEGRAVSTLSANPTGSPQVKFVVNLVAVIDEEPEIDSVQRNYKPLFDYINERRDVFMPILIGWLEAISGAIPGEKLQEMIAQKQKPFNE